MLFSGQCGSDCNVGYGDLAPLITSASVPQYIRVPFKGKRDGIRVNGIQINQPCGETDEVFEICFDSTKVGGTQSSGTIGLKDTWGNGDACVVQNTLPDFCGGVTPEPTNRPTNLDQPLLNQLKNLQKNQRHQSQVQDQLLTQPLQVMIVIMHFTFFSTKIQIVFYMSHHLFFPFVQIC